MIDTVAIARTLILEPKILLLDEATSVFDAIKSETQVQVALDVVRTG
jgi:ABC-type bacteriocin/lantibiotic exporter with double-glycine peptidase domain